MIGELDIYGAYVPWLLVLGLGTWVLNGFLQRVLARLGAYRLVWHPPLFNLALYVLLLYGVTRLSPWILPR
jgi:hypothetical protein